MKNCIINLANNDKWYVKGQQRLVNSLKPYSGFDVLTFNSVSEVGAPLHKDNPYAFKPYAFYKAIELGYDNILWLDSSVWVVKDPAPIFDIINNDGYFMMNSGHNVSSWINDNALNYFNAKSDDLNYEMFIAGLFGLSMENGKAVSFLNRWKYAADCGVFKGSWKDHRHDMTCGSIIAHELGMQLKDNSEWSAYIGTGYSEPKESAIFYLQGM